MFEGCRWRVLLASPRRARGQRHCMRGVGRTCGVGARGSAITGGLEVWATLVAGAGVQVERQADKIGQAVVVAAAV